MQPPQLHLLRLSGDICTKARRTRARFTRILTENLHDALATTVGEHRVDARWSRIFVEAEDPVATEVLARVFGISSLSPVERCSWESLEELLDAACRHFIPRVSGRSFAVRARRGVDPKRIPFTSEDVERRLGTLLLEHARSVDLEEPEITAYLEIHPGQAYLFSHKKRGLGGLPVGVGGRALALVSGGFDSAVASWLMLKRGLALDYLFFNLGGPTHQRGVLQVMKILADRWSYGQQPRLHAVDFRELVRQLQEQTEPRYWQVLLKRLMLRAGELMARRLRRPALITGEAVGQVSSQTLANLAVLSQATPMTILRPLVGFNKEEIVDLAREIGTYEISATVAEYCAILPRHPATAASLKAVEREEAKLDLEALEELVDDRRVFDLRRLRPADLGDDAHAVEEIPAGARVVDLRSRAAYESWHHPGAEWHDYLALVNDFEHLDRGQTWVFYCEFGLKSAHLAELLTAAGYRAHDFPRGATTLRRSLEEDPLEESLLAPALRS